MSSSAPTTRLPWEDRWVQPTIDLLLEPYEASGKRKVLESLLENMHAFEGINSEMIWHGTAWKWAQQYTLFDEKGKQVDVMAYFVPMPETPLLCVPLRDAVINQMPIRRLNRFIREGIRSAKCAVELHWAIWSPSAATEVEHLTDLFKRKHKLLRGG